MVISRLCPQLANSDLSTIYPLLSLTRYPQSQNGEDLELFLADMPVSIQYPVLSVTVPALLLD